MKKFFLLILITCNLTLLSAQGIYQLWGVRHMGGNDELGSIFSTDAFGNNFQTRHQIKAVNPGGNPKFSTLVEYNGKFYGVTSKGGRFDKGVIFEWDAVANSYIKKIEFDGINGHTPSGGLTLFGNKFYGIAARDNQYEAMIFEWNPVSNIYARKFKFIDTDGKFPIGDLQLLGNKFYGMTSGGGNYGAGEIFEWDPLSNIYTKKVDFNPSAGNGSSPCSNLSLSNGKFYGMTTYGGGNGNKGSIFEWDPVTNICQEKFGFDNDGYRPSGSLSLLADKFYGFTSLGGTNNMGTLFEWDPITGIYTKKVNLDAPSGNIFLGSLTSVGSKFFGMMRNGGNYNKGVIFDWDNSSNLLTKRIDLSDTIGNSPTGQLAWSNGKLYGMTDVGGVVSGKGVIFEFDTTSNMYTKKIEFDKRESGSSPTRSLTYYNEKLYGMATHGGKNDAGIIYELDPATNIYTKKIDLADIHARGPNGNLLLRNGKFYGMTKFGGNSNGYGPGTIFEWDPTTNVCIRKVTFDGVNGIFPDAGLTFFNGKFYGMAFQGGSDPSGNGTIFEWDPISNVCSKKIDFNGLNGQQPICNLTLYNNKFYGMTFEGGVNTLGGVLFEWDPITNIYKKLVDFGDENNNGFQPMGSLTVHNGKLYGTTHGGGPHFSGNIFELDPATKTFTSRYDFGGSSFDWHDGFYPHGSLTMSNGKFYGMTNAGGDSVNRYGVIFEWDPASNVYTKKKDLTDKENGWFEKGQDLSLVPAPLATRVRGSCVNFPVVTIDNKNNNIWVPIIDSLGNAVAEINANGNNLGLVNSNMYANNGPVREDAAKKLYLDMNLTITPQFQPTFPINLRIYLKNSEYTSLKNAVNSEGQTSGISSISDISIFKNDDTDCSSSMLSLTNTVHTVAATWQNDLVVSASTSSFSSFYFASKNFTALPLTLLEFSGRLLNKNALLNWKTDQEQNVGRFEIERSLDGNNYEVIGTTASIGTPGKHSYSFTDTKTSTFGKTFIYYRLKQQDIGGRFTYSKIVIIRMDNYNSFILFPNPVADKATLLITVSKVQKVNARMVDNTGRAVKELYWNLPEGSSSLSINVGKLAKGIYYLELRGETIHERKQFTRE